MHAVIFSWLILNCVLLASRATIVSLGLPECKQKGPRVRLDDCIAHRLNPWKDDRWNFVTTCNNSECITAAFVLQTRDSREMCNWVCDHCAGEDPLVDDQTDQDINSVAGVLKLYFRGLENPLFPKERFLDLISTTSELISRGLFDFGICSLNSSTTHKKKKTDWRPPRRS